MKRLVLSLVTLLGACDNSTVVSSPLAEDPCTVQTYQSSLCDTNYAWTPGYYNSTHIWIAPRYTRRTVYVHPAPVIVRSHTVYVRPASPAIVIRPTVRPSPPRVYAPSVKRPPSGIRFNRK